MTVLAGAASAGVGAGGIARRETRGLPVERLTPVVIAAVVLAIAIVTITPWPVGTFQDDAVYVVLAKALATGEGYRMINMPGAPHATHFPPGYPLFLAILWKLFPTFPDNVVVFKFANAVLLAVAAVGTYRFSRDRAELGLVGAAVAALLGTVSIVVILVTGVVLSEPMFMALLLPTLIVTERVVDDGGMRRAIVAGLLIGALAMVRTVGVLVLPAALLALVVRGRWRAAVVLGVAAAIVIAPWQLWISAYQGEIPAPFVGKYGAYGQWLVQGYREGGFALASAVLAKNANELFGFFGFATLPVNLPIPRLVSLAAVVALVSLGAWRARHRVSTTAAFIVTYIAIILVWPFEPTRFALVLWPLLVPLFVLGMRTVVEWRPALTAAQALRAVALVSTLVVSAGYGWYNIWGYRDRWWATMQRDLGGRATPVAEWVASATMSGDVLVTDHDLVVYLYSGRQAVPTVTFHPRSHVAPLTPEEDTEMLRTILSFYRPRFYVATTPYTVGMAKRLAAESPPRLRFVRDTRSAVIYEPVSQ